MTSGQTYDYVASTSVEEPVRPPGKAIESSRTLRYHPARRLLSSSTMEQYIAEVIGHEGAFAMPWTYRLTKRIFDVLASGIALILLAPLMSIVAVLIKLDSPGSVFFVQERIGHLGKPFRLIKFRTMVDGNTMKDDGEIHKRRNDTRVTKIGAFLRTTSLDELPQLINVLKGEMSLVGPRPEITGIVQEYYEPWQYERFLVPQGITGWWQVTGRGAKLLREHTADDLYYIMHASLWFDIVILFMTVRAVIKRDGAF